MVNGASITTDEPINDGQGCTEHYNDDREETDEF